MSQVCVYILQWVFYLSVNPMKLSTRTRCRKVRFPLPQSLRRKLRLIGSARSFQLLREYA